MFRQENQEKFGVGSIVVVGPNEAAYLVVRVGCFDRVKLLNVYTLELSKETWAVEDPSWLTREEFDKLFAFTGCTMSDFTIHHNTDLVSGVNVSY